MKRIAYLGVLLSGLSGLCAAQPVGTSAPSGPPRWFKGNTHAHAKTWLPIPHGDSSPRRLAQWYADHGYDFLCMSDHNRLSQERRARRVVRNNPEFLLITGTEITSDTRMRLRYQRQNPGAPDRVVHTTALGIDRASWDPDVWKAFGPQSSVADILLTHRRATDAAGGISILNHPNFRDPITAQDVIDAGIGFFEVYNAYPHAKNEAGHSGHSTDELWDEVLSRGHRLYGVASDDAHHTKRWNVGLTEKLGIRAPAGGAWIMVRARERSQSAILNAMRAGDFYASSGIHLRRHRVHSGRLEVAIDLPKTWSELSKGEVWAPARETTSSQRGPRIEFVTAGGRVLASVDAASASVPVSAATRYLRVHVSYVVHSSVGTKVFHAWTQPIFLNGGITGALTGTP